MITCLVPTRCFGRSVLAAATDEPAIVKGPAGHSHREGPRTLGGGAAGRRLNGDERNGRRRPAGTRRSAGADRACAHKGSRRGRPLRRDRGAGRDRQDGSCSRPPGERRRTAGCACFASRGTELERDFAFGVVRQLFEPPLAEASELERADLLQGGRRRGGRPPRLPEAPPRRSPPRRASIRRSRSCTASTGYAPICRRCKAAMLVVDDAHWADAPPCAISPSSSRGSKS